MEYADPCVVPGSVGPWYWTCTWGRFAIELWGGDMLVSKLRTFGKPPHWVVVFPSAISVRGQYDDLDERWYAMKWIKLAVSKKAKKKPESLPVDAGFLRDREAIAEFMTELVGPDGKPREPSAVMIVFCDEGARVGLKDEDAGGWCWRVGPTVQDALDAIEKALKEDESPFKGPRQQRDRKTRR